MSGLESGDAAKRCRPKYRASRLLADREGYHAGRHRRSRAARAAARRVFQVTWIACRSRGSICESGGHRFTKQDGATAAQLTNHTGVFSTETALVERRTVFGRHSLSFEN